MKRDLAQKMDNIPSLPLKLSWHLTYKCNYTCKHCYSRSRVCDELSSDDRMKTAEKLIKLKLFNINFGGGEPLMEKEDLLRVIQRCSSAGIVCDIVTNGSLLTDKVAKELSKAGTNQVWVSLDSHKEDINNDFRNCPTAFDSAIKAIKLVKSVGLKSGIASVITKFNHLSLEPLIQIARDQKVDEIKFQPFRPIIDRKNVISFKLSPQQLKRAFQKLIKLSKKTSKPEILYQKYFTPLLYTLIDQKELETDRPLVFGCTCGKLSLCIKANGDITPCSSFDIKLGNVITDSIKDVWQNSKFLKKMRTRMPKGKCQSCKYLLTCRGGCSALAYYKDGSLEAHDPYCWM